MGGGSAETGRRTLTDPGTSSYDRGVRTSGLSTTHRYILEHIPRGSTVLELGPASGYMSREMMACGCTVDAVELNPEDARIATEFCRTMVVGSVEDPAVLERLKGPYDVIVMADVLEHLREPAEVLHRVRRLLKPSGRALVSLPNIAHWRMRLSLLAGKFEYTETDLLDRTHLRFYTRDTAAKLFRAGGFEVHRIVVPPVPHSRYRALHDLVRKTFPTLFSVNFIFHLQAPV